MMIRRSLVVLVAILVAFVVPAAAAQATGYPPRPYPAVPVTMTVKDSTLRPGQTTWVRVTGPVGERVRVTVTRAGTNRVVYTTTGVIRQHGSTSYAQVNIRMWLPSRYTVTGKVSNVPNSTRTQTVTVRVTPPRWHWHASRS